MRKYFWRILFLGICLGGIYSGALVLLAQTKSVSAVSINAVGDTVMGTNFPDYRLPANPFDLFSPVVSYLKTADVVFGNYESTLTDHPTSAKPVGRKNIFAFRSPPSYAKTLKEAGFHILSIANNHSMDFQQKGFDDTHAHINAAGMKAFGRKNEIVYYEAKGVRFAFIGYSYMGFHNNMHDLAASARLVKKAKENADIVVCSYHAGKEGDSAIHTKNEVEFFFGENRGNTVQFSRAMIDAGADLILGHGPHVPRALELYKERLIVYSLGNFLGYKVFSIGGAKGISFILTAHLEKNGKFVSGKITPLKLIGAGIPHYDDKGRAIQLIKRLTRSDFPNTKLNISDTGEIFIK